MDGPCEQKALVSGVFALPTPGPQESHVYRMRPGPPSSLQGVGGNQDGIPVGFVCGEG